MFEFFQKQFIDVIELPDIVEGLLALQYPMEGSEIQNGAQLIVREAQLALFVNEGRLADVFHPGTHTLTTQNLPLLTNLMNWGKQFQSPFKSDVYFFSTLEQIDQKWGTQTPIMYKDKEYGPLRLRAYGTYAYRVSDPRVFYQKLSGTREFFGAENLSGQLLSMILTEIGSYLGAAQFSFLEISANQNQFSEWLKTKLTVVFSEYGLELSRFYVQSVTLPEELQAQFDKVAAMHMIGDMGQYTKFQAAESLTIAAKNEGGLAGLGAGMGTGAFLGHTFAQAFSAEHAPVNGADPGNESEIFDEISKLHELMTKGIVTQAEFDLKKAELLKRI